VTYPLLLCPASRAEYPTISLTMGFGATFGLEVAGLPSPFARGPVASAARGATLARGSRPFGVRRRSTTGGRASGKVTSTLSVRVSPQDDNHYQELLCGELGKAGVRARYAEGPTRSQTVNLLVSPALLAVHRLRGFRFLHFHWFSRSPFPGQGAHTGRVGPSNGGSVSTFGLRRHSGMSSFGRPMTYFSTSRSSPTMGRLIGSI
jgi:hypothetical protein